VRATLRHDSLIHEALGILGFNLESVPSLSQGGFAAALGAGGMDAADDVGGDGGGVFGAAGFDVGDGGGGAGALHANTTYTRTTTGAARHSAAAAAAVKAEADAAMDEEEEEGKRRRTTVGLYKLNPADP
jgi:hypothetical protein